MVVKTPMSAESYWATTAMLRATGGTLSVVCV